MAPIRTARSMNGTPYWRSVWFLTEAKGRRETERPYR
jgi:hypothetical protein